LKNQLDLKGRDGVVFVDYEHGFIGASPDYLVIMPCGKRALLEIKCTETAKNLGIGEWIKSRKETKANCCMEVGKNRLLLPSTVSA